MQNTAIFAQKSVQWPMETDRTLAISTLRSLIFHSRGEENRLRGILNGMPNFIVKLRTRSTLEKATQKRKALSKELARLVAEL